MKRAFSVIIFIALLFFGPAVMAQPVASVVISETTGTDTICAGVQVAYTAVPTNGGSSPIYHWYLNGFLIPSLTGSVFSSAALPTGTDHIYCIMASSLAGVTDSLSTSDTLTLTVNPRPVAMISDSDSICNGESGHITFTITNGSQWQVIFINGARPDTITAYASPWTYYLAPTTTTTYHITSVSNGVCSALPAGISGSGLIVVNPIPVPLITSLDSIQCFKNNTFNFSASHSTVSSGSITQWSWSFGSLSPDTASGPAPTIHFTDTGSHQLVELIETTNKGCQNATGIYITVKSSPNASFAVSDTAICLGSTISVGAIVDTSATYTWYWSSTSDSICRCDTLYHTYSTFNDKKVHLSVTNDAGCTDTSSVFIHVHALPQASFIINDTSQCYNGNNFTFTDHSTISNTQQYGDSLSSYVWDFGDQSAVSDSISPAHTYTSNTKKTYTITELITSSFGCLDSIQKRVYVFHTPNINITNSAGRDTICARSSYTLTAVTDAVQPSYRWSATDTTNTISGISDTAVVTSSQIVYTIKITDEANNKCMDSAVEVITSVPNPQVPIINNGLIPVACDSSTVHFDVTNLQDSVSYFWYTSPALPISGQNYPHSNITFATSDSAIVYVVASNVWGCSVSNHDTIRISSGIAPSVTIAEIADMVDSTLIAIAIPDTGISYQWGYDGAGFASTPIAGATAQSLLLDSGQNSAQYWVIVTDTSTQCATKIYVNAPVTTTGIRDINGAEAQVMVYPNPSLGMFNMSIQSSTAQDWSVEILDLNGRLIESTKTTKEQNINREIDASAWAAGAYLMRVISGSGDVKVLKLIRK